MKSASPDDCGHPAITNGLNLTVSGQTNGTTNGELSITVGGTVSLAEIYQWNLGYMSVKAGTVNISGNHQVVNSGHRCDVTGGTVNYTSTGTNLTLYTNNTGWGYYATAGTINFSGSINTNSTVYFQATGTSVIRFIGTVAATVRHTTASWSWADLRIEKTGGAGVTFTAGTANSANFTITSLTVNSGASLTLGGAFNAGYGFAFGTISNAGTLNLSTMAVTVSGNVTNSGTISGGTSSTTFTGTSTISNTGTLGLNNVAINAGATVTAPSSTLSVSGNWTKTGTFTHNSGTVAFTGTTTATISGNSAFYNLTCTAAGKQLTFTAGSNQTVTGSLTLTGASGNTIKLRSSSVGTTYTITDSGSENVSYVDVQDCVAANSITDYPGGVDTGNNTNWLFTSGPTLTVAVTTGTVQVVAANYTGPGGNGIQAGTFTITNNNQGASYLDAIILGSSGTGDDSADYSSVEVWEESNATSGYQTGDTKVGSTATGFATDNGTATFTYASQQTFASSEARTYYVVVKLNGTGSANETYNYSVTNITVGGTTNKQGVPSGNMIGLRIEQPTLAVGGATGVNGNVYANETGSGNGYQAASFTITAGTEGTATLTGITLTASGTGDDSTDYSEIAIWRESNATAGFQTGDTQIGTAATSFSANNGTATFTVQAGEQSFAASAARTYYIVIKLNGAASPAETFNFSVSAITASGGTTTSGTPTSAMNGVTILAPSFTYADASPATAQAGYLGSSGNVVQKFSISYPNGPSNSQTSITVTALGTGHDVNDLSSVELWLDDGTGTYSSSSDTQIASGTYSADNGTCAFNLSAQTAFTAPETRTYFVIYDFNLAGTNNSTFQCYVSASSGHSTGTTISGIPTPSITGTAGLILNSNVLTATLNGPGTAVTVDSNSQGSTGDGELLCDVTLLAAGGSAWTVTELKFVGTGTATQDTAYSELGVYEDNGNGTWDGATTDLAAAATVTGFASGTNDATFTLTNSAFVVGTGRRFYLAGKLAGTATAGQTLNARLDAVTTTPPTGGVTSGIATSSTTALMIDVAVLTAAQGAANPINYTHKAGTTRAHLLGHVLLAASNNTVSVSGITFTTSGTGNWTTSFDPTSGFEVFEDNGDGVFNAGTDTSIYAGAGGATVNALFTTSVSVPNAGSKQLWVRVNLLATAGVGSTTAITFSAGIAAATDISVSGGITTLLGTPAPNCSTLSVVDFFATTFDPLADFAAGGKPITITGSGFAAPFTVTIGGVVCPGTPTVTPTQVTGLSVPPGSGTSLPIVITSGNLGPQTLTQRFSYSNTGTVSTGRGGGGGGGCVAAESTNVLWALAAPAVGLLSLLRRRRRSK